MKYEACFRANNFSICSCFYYYNDKKTAIKEIRKMAELNRFKDGDCNWVVYIADKDIRVAAGGKTRDGKRYRLQ